MVGCLSSCGAARYHLRPQPAILEAIGGRAVSVLTEIQQDIIA